MTPLRARPVASAAGFAAVTIGLAIGLAGCHSSGSHPTASASASPTALAPPSSTAPASATAAPTPSPTSSTPSSSAVPSSPSPTPIRTSSSAPVTVRECGVPDLTLKVQRGGATLGQEIALLSFTNSARTPCSMTGFPGVSLRLAGAALGAPAVRTTVAHGSVVLKPGQVATATLYDTTSCQADLSDTVRVYPPDSTAYIDQPLVLRGCHLSIDPVQAAG